jgi:hypothetical protein
MNAAFSINEFAYLARERPGVVADRADRMPENETSAGGWDHNGARGFNCTNIDKAVVFGAGDLINSPLSKMWDQRVAGAHHRLTAGDLAGEPRTTSASRERQIWFSGSSRIPSPEGLQADLGQCTPIKPI